MQRKQEGKRQDQDLGVQAASLVGTKSRVRAEYSQGDQESVNNTQKAWEVVNNKTKDWEVEENGLRRENKQVEYCQKGCARKGRSGGRRSNLEHIRSNFVLGPWVIRYNLSR